MNVLNEYIDEYQHQLEIGVIQKAYRGLMEYIMALRIGLARNHPDYLVPSNIYSGYMDMTYFSIIPPSLQQVKLKIAVVYLHEQRRFEAWLAGANKQVQAKYWTLIKENHWNKYHLVPSIKSADSIIEYVLVDHADFNDLNALTKRIEDEVLIFINDVEKFLTGSPALHHKCSVHEY